MYCPYNFEDCGGGPAEYYQQLFSQPFAPVHRLQRRKTIRSHVASLGSPRPRVAYVLARASQSAFGLSAYPRSVERTLNSLSTFTQQHNFSFSCPSFLISSASYNESLIDSMKNSSRLEKKTHDSLSFFHRTRRQVKQRALITSSIRQSERHLQLKVCESWTPFRARARSGRVVETVRKTLPLLSKYLDEITQMYILFQKQL